MLEVFPVVAVVGPRQVGKSTLVQEPEIGQGRHYRTLDDISTRGLAQSDPTAFLSKSDWLTVDEVQLAPELLREMKRLIDVDRRPGRFLLTGSAELNYCADISHVLAGRVGILHLPPICWSEEHQSTLKFLTAWTSTTDLATFEKSFVDVKLPEWDWYRVVAGGFPLSLLATNKTARDMWFQAFRTTYLERDIRRISDIGNLAGFDRLMELTATRTACLLNQASLARDSGLTPATCGRYLSVLEASLLVRRQTPYFTNIGKRMVKSPKLYWEDTGVAAYLLGLGSTQELLESRLCGQLFETFVMNEVSAMSPLVKPSANVHFIRTHTGLEVDGLLQAGGRLHPFEIKCRETIRTEDAAPVRQWQQVTGNCEIGVVFYTGTELRRLGGNVLAVPVTALLL